MEPSSPVVRQVAPSKTALESHNSHAYSIQREELLACGSAMRMRHLSVTLSVEFADTDIAQKAHYWPNTDNRFDNWSITNVKCCIRGCYKNFALTCFVFFRCGHPQLCIRPTKLVSLELQVLANVTVQVSSLCVVWFSRYNNFFTFIRV